MIHSKRRFSVLDVQDAEELADKLTQHVWCGCCGFRHAGLLYLNDSTSPDGAGEWAIFDEQSGVQIDSVTFGWMDTADEALETIRLLSSGNLRTPMSEDSVPRIETPDEHGSCPLCE